MRLGLFVPRELGGAGWPHPKGWAAGVRSSAWSAKSVWLLATQNRATIVKSGALAAGLLWDNGGDEAFRDLLQVLCSREHVRPAQFQGTLADTAGDFHAVRVIETGMGNLVADPLVDVVAREMGANRAWVVGHPVLEAREEKKTSWRSSAAKSISKRVADYRRKIMTDMPHMPERFAPRTMLKRGPTLLAFLRARPVIYHLPGPVLGGSDPQIGRAHV